MIKLNTKTKGDKMINWDSLKKEESVTILKIVVRAKKLIPELPTLDTNMDIGATHINKKLNLDKLLKFNDFNFLHDITGITYNINRETGKLENCFLPRCSA